MGADLLLALGLPLLLLVGLTLWLANGRHQLPSWLARLEARSGTIWVSGVVLMISIIVVRQLLQLAR
jgi:hypothetical protein